MTLRYRVTIPAGVFDFFAVAAARAFALRWNGTILDLRSGQRVEATPSQWHVPRGLLSYEGKAATAPKAFARDAAAIRSHARRISGKRHSHSPEVLAQAREAWRIETCA